MAIYKENNAQKFLNNINEYIIVNNNYNKFATDLALTIKKLDNLTNSAKTIVNQFDATVNQMATFIINCIWRSYKAPKYVFLFDDIDLNKITIYFYKTKEFQLAQIAYEEYVTENYDVINDMDKTDKLIAEGMVFADSQKEEKEEYKKRIDFLTSYLKKPCYKCTISQEQYDVINKLVENHLHAEQRKDFVQEELTNLQEQYAAMLATVMEILGDDEEYPQYDMETAEVFTLKTEQNGPWRLAFTI